MKKRNIILFLIMIILTSPLTGCFIYHKPVFRGQVIDAETREPIEGAVVVVQYDKMAMGIPEKNTKIINVRETLTDREGMFRIPSYTTLIAPFSWEESALFILYKPGYASISRLNLEDYLSDGNNKEVNVGQKRRISHGIVELPKLKTKEERKLAKPAPVGDESEFRKQKNLIRTIRQEYEYLYGEGEAKCLYSTEEEKECAK